MGGRRQAADGTMDDALEGYRQTRGPEAQYWYAREQEESAPSRREGTEFSFSTEEKPQAVPVSSNEAVMPGVYSAPKTSPTKNAATNNPGKQTKNKSSKSKPDLNGIGAGINAGLGILSGITGAAAKLGDASRSLIQAGLNPGKSHNKILDAGQQAAEAAQVGIKGMADTRKQFKENKKMIYNAKLKDPQHIIDFDQLEKDTMADLEATPFEDWDSVKAAEVMDSVKKFFDDRGLDVNRIPANSELGKRVTRLKNAINSKAHEKMRDRDVERGKSNLAAKVMKDNARFDAQHKQQEYRNIFHANAVDLQNRIDDPNTAEDERALATAIHVVTGGRGTKAFGDNLDKKTADAVAKKLEEMWDNETDPAKKDAIEQAYRSVKERSVGLNESHIDLEGRRSDSYVDDLNLTPEQVVRRRRGLSNTSQSGTYGSGIPTNRRDAMEMSEIATQRTASYYNRRRNAQTQQERDQLDHEYGTTTAYQNAEVYLNSQLADILRNTQERTFTTAEADNLPYEPTRLLLQFGADDGNGNVNFVPASTLIRDRELYPQAYRQFTNDRKGYMIANVVYEMNRGKDLLRQAQQRGIVGHDANGNIRSGLDLTIEDLAAGGLFDPNDPSTIPDMLAGYFADKDGNKYLWDDNPNKDLRIGDIIGRNVDMQLSTIDGQKGKYYHKDTDQVGMSQPEMIAGIYSILSGHLGANFAHPPVPAQPPATGQGQPVAAGQNVPAGNGGQNGGNPPVGIPSTVNPQSQSIYDRTHIGPDAQSNVNFFTSDGTAKPVAQLTADDYIASYDNIRQIHAHGYISSNGGKATYNNKTHEWEGDPDAVNEAIIVENTHNRQKPLKFLKTIIDDQSGTFPESIKDRAADLYEIVMTTSPDTTIGVAARESFTRLLDDIEHMDDISNPTIPVFGSQVDRIFANAIGLGDATAFRNMMLLPNGSGTQYFSNTSRLQYRQDSNDGDPYLAPRNVFARALRGRLDMGYF